MENLDFYADQIRQAGAKSVMQTPSPVLEAAGWRLDTSRQILDDTTRDRLNVQAETANLGRAISQLFEAEIVNPSEGRPALHWAMRSQGHLEGEAQTARASLGPALAFADKIRANGRVKTIIHIGIGGSDFGPRLIADAFADQGSSKIDLRFVANVDPMDFSRAIEGADPAATLVIGVSKSFGTEETLYNLGQARAWLEASLGDKWASHVALITANRVRAETWLGQESTQIFDMPLSVGGRFSLWSAASLACIIWLGTAFFNRVLAGAAQMDTHVKTTPLGQNMAVQLALLDYWNSRHMGFDQRVVLAYANRLRLLPTYLQQLEMESNGKSISSNGESVQGMTAPTVWGGEGSVGQHSYHQWLHQGTHIVPAEFILCPDIDGESAGREALIAHALAQAEVMANGLSVEAVKAAQPNLDAATAQQKTHAGGRPSSFFFHPQFGPEAFGALVALYEHRTYLVGQLWGVNPFDQWGVEFGKIVAGGLRPALRGEEKPADKVTAQLLDVVNRA